MSETVIAPRPEWFRTLVRKYRDGEGHAFLLSGPGIHDIDASSYSLHANIYHIFGNKSVPNKSSIFDFDIVVRYDAHNGFRFLGGPEKRKADRDKFKELVEKLAVHLLRRRASVGVLAQEEELRLPNNRTFLIAALILL